VGYDVNFRVSVDEASAVFLNRSLVECAESLTERDQILVRQMLIAEEQYLSIEPGAMDRFEDRLVYRANVDAADLCAKGTARRNDLECGAQGHRCGTRRYQIPKRSSDSTACPR